MRTESKRTSRANDGIVMCGTRKAAAPTRKAAAKNRTVPALGLKSNRLKWKSAVVFGTIRRAAKETTASEKAMQAAENRKDVRLRERFFSHWDFSWRMKRRFAAAPPRKKNVRKRKSEEGNVTFSESSVLLRRLLPT